MNASVIIRVKNEKENLIKVLKKLKEQSFQDFEIIIVNDNSTDGSEKIAFEQFPKKRVKVVDIENGKFTYPHAANLGAEKANGKFLVFLSAHSYPITNTWLQDGLKDFINDKIAGVFAYPLSGIEGTIAERLLFDLRNIIVGSRKKFFTKPKNGLLGFTNAIIRKNLWDKYPIDESFSRGVEDAAWAICIIKNGYTIIQDPKFRVYHSHNLSFKGVLKRRQEWRDASALSIRHDKI
jgi:glycosyltransferase involved in cell wall biosynthesis